MNYNCKYNYHYKNVAKIGISKTTFHVRGINSNVPTKQLKYVVKRKVTYLKITVHFNSEHVTEKDYGNIATRFSYFTIATRNYWHALIFATVRMEDFEDTTEISKNRPYKNLNFDKMRRKGGLSRDSHIWVVPIQTVCRATIVICSHITTVPGGIQGLLPVPEGKTRIITTVLGGYTRPLFQRAKQGRLPLFQGALQGLLPLFQRALQGLLPLFQGALQGLLPLFQGAYKAPLTRSQTSNVGNNSLVLSHGAS